MSCTRIVEPYSPDAASQDKDGQWGIWEGIVVGFLMSVFDAMGLDVQIRGGLGEEAEVSTESGARGRLMLELVTDDAALLIGRRGSHLDALQLLANRFAVRQSNYQCPVCLDCDGYRARREDDIRRMSERLAAKVVSTGKSCQLLAMSSGERRVVHLGLQGL